MKFLNRYNYPVNPLGLDIFRVVFGIILLFDIIELFKLSDIYFYNPISSPLHTKELLLIFAAVCIAFILGIKQKIITPILFSFSCIFFTGASFYEYHVYYAYSGILFLLIFIPHANILTLNNIIKKKAIYSFKTLAIHYYVLIFTAIAFVYWDSIAYKLISNLWMNGIGMWKPLSIPYASIVTPNFITESSFLSKSLGYFTVTFELLFGFLFLFYKRSRFILAIIGIGLHLGITIALPIPLFGLACASVYILVLPFKSWDSILNKLNIKYKHLEYSSINILRLSKAIIIIQIFITLGSGGFSKIFGSIGLDTYGFSNLIAKYTKYISLTHHPVFMDFHFDQRETVYSLGYITDDGKEFSFMYNENGTPKNLIFGSSWVYYTFRVNSGDLTDYLNNSKRYQNYCFNKVDSDSLIVFEHKYSIPSNFSLDTIKANYQNSFNTVHTIYRK